MFASLQIKNNSESNDLSDLTDIGIPYIDLVYIDPLDPVVIYSAIEGERIIICNKNERTKVLQWIENEEPASKHFLKELWNNARFEIIKHSLCQINEHSAGKYFGLVGTASDTILTNSHNNNLAHITPYVFDKNDPFSIDNFQLINKKAFVTIENRIKLNEAMTALIQSMHVLEKENELVYVVIVINNDSEAFIGFSHGSERESIINLIDANKGKKIDGTIIMNFGATEEIARTTTRHFNDAQSSVRKRKFDIVASTDFSKDAIAIFGRRKDACRMFKNAALSMINGETLHTGIDFTYERGGILLNENI